MSKGADFNRVKLDKGVTNYLQYLQSTTGLTPNYLARAGLCYSLSEPRPPNPEEYDTDGKAINRYTLLGEHDPLYIAMVRQRLINEGRDPDEELYKYFVAHTNRGIKTLNGRIDSLADFYEVLPGELKPDE